MSKVMAAVSALPIDVWFLIAALGWMVFMWLLYIFMFKTVRQSLRAREDVWRD